MTIAKDLLMKNTKSGLGKKIEGEHSETDKTTTDLVLETEAQLYKNNKNN